ncbi:hypothetical protein GCM10025786_24300 [Nocardioides caeni]
MLSVGVVRDLLAAATAGAHGSPGAQIHDHDRDVTYRASVDPATSDLDHLEVVVRGWIDDNVLKRVPVARIRREVLAQVAEDRRARAAGGPDALTFVRPGGLVGGDGGRYSPPPLDEVARLMREGLDRHALAERFGRPLRTVDGWIRRARQEYPDDVPPRTSGRRRSTKASGGEGRRANRGKEGK